MAELNTPQYILLTNKAKAVLAALLATPAIVAGAGTFAKTGNTLESLFAGALVEFAGIIVPVACYYVDNLIYGQHQLIMGASR